MVNLTGVGWKSRSRQQLGILLRDQSSRRELPPTNLDSQIDDGPKLVRSEVTAVQIYTHA